MPSPFFFVVLKGTEKGSPQECRAYPASVVGDGQDCPTAALIRLDSDLASRLDRVASVKKQIGDYAAELVPVHTDFWLELELFHDAYPGLAFEYFKRVSDKQIKVHLSELGSRRRKAPTRLTSWLMRFAVSLIPRKASCRNAGSSKCTGKFCSVRLKVEAAFFKSCTKNADIA